ncbi:MAG: prolipoprotein diacylglyceryl transferase [Phycisphaerae bacterium]
MHPKLLTLPGGLTVTTYGFFLMIGFLSAVWFAMRRARRVKVDPDRVLDLSFFALIFGVGGARLMYVIHYWRSSFADQPNQLLAIVDIRNGGLEFLGGLLGASAAILTYLLITRQSIRLYLDILAPGAMWGLAFGRLGCFFNGCCFGGLCSMAAAPVDAAAPVWAVRFPFGGLAHMRQWEEREVAVPAELIVTHGLGASLLPSAALSDPYEKRKRILTAYDNAVRAVALARKNEAPAEELKRAEAALAAADRLLTDNHLKDLRRALRYPSRKEPKRTIALSELEALASASRSKPVYATQLFSSMHGFILSLFLSCVFYIRKRHGVVIGLLFLMYPLARIPLEIIRADNPHDVGGLTISQSLSLAMSVGALVYLVILFKALPERSPVIATMKPVVEQKPTA